MKGWPRILRCTQNDMPRTCPGMPMHVILSATKNLMGNYQFYCPSFFLSLHLAQFDAANLAGDRLGQAVHTLDLAWILVGGRDALHMLLQLACQFGRGSIARGQDDEGFHDFA